MVRTRLSSLNRKLVNDIRAMRGQVIAITVVVGVGVAMLVGYASTLDSLRGTLHTYYERQRFPDVFASLKRAPRTLEARIASLPGVAVVDTRVVAEATLDVPGLREPAIGRLLSVPADRRPALNDVFLTAGRWVEVGRDEVLLSATFARAHGLVPGDHIAALINGRRREFAIAGLGLSAEFIYAIRRGDLIPDNRRFAILWMERSALGTAFQMDGGFNDVALALTPGTVPEGVIPLVDRLLSPYGGRGAIPRRLQASHWTIENELRQLRMAGFVVPAIFFGVAAFLLNVTLTRTLAIQRPQVAVLKALGYTNAALGWHYLKFALLIVALGAAAGIPAGAVLGAGMLDLYNDVFRFPVLLYRVSTSTAAAAGAVALIASAGVGAMTAVRRAVRIPAAEAMRPEPPARYRRTALDSYVRLPHAARMVVRHIARRPVRALLSLAGLASAVAIFFFGLIFLRVMTDLAELQFDVAQRQDVTLTFVQPVSAAARYELRKLPGVLSVQPVRTLPVRLRFGSRERYLALTGVPRSPALQRIVTRDGLAVDLPLNGLVLSKMLAEILGVGPGDVIDVEPLEELRRVRRISVAGVVDDVFGLWAYLDMEALHRLLHEDRSLSGAHLQVDTASMDALYTRLKMLSKVSGVTITAAARESFDRIMARNFRIITTANITFALIITIGIVYNTFRVSLSERSRELATLRVLGFTLGEISLILLGELALLTIAALPVGLVTGGVLAKLVAVMLQNELYRLDVHLAPQDAAVAILTVLGTAAVVALIGARQLQRLDLLGVLKAPE
jgi:putative ABC transport system permease protein